MARAYPAAEMRRTGPAPSARARNTGAVIVNYYYIKQSFTPSAADGFKEEEKTRCGLIVYRQSNTNKRILSYYYDDVHHIL